MAAAGEMDAVGSASLSSLAGLAESGVEGPDAAAFGVAESRADKVPPAAPTSCRCMLLTRPTQHDFGRPTPEDMWEKLIEKWNGGSPHSYSRPHTLPRPDLMLGPSDWAPRPLPRTPRLQRRCSTLARARLIRCSR